jgi:hypothetical protein
MPTKCQSAEKNADINMCRTGAEVRLEPLDHVRIWILTHTPLLLARHGVSFVTEAGLRATPSLPFCKVYRIVLNTIFSLVR